MQQSPSTVYIGIQANEPPDLDTRVLAVIQQRVGKEHRITRRALVAEVFRVRITSEDDLSNMTIDRQVRDAIARLRERYPIMSSSGDGGYWWPGSLDEVMACAGEMVSRARKLEQAAASLRRMAVSEFGPQLRLPGT